MAPDCIFDHEFRASCSFRLPRTDQLHATAYLDTCRSPSQLEITLEVGETIWRHVFLSSNLHETRIVGPEHWPLLLHSYFLPDKIASNSSTIADGNSTYPGSGDGTGSRSLFVQSCVQVVKAKETVCFLRHRLTELSSQCNDAGYLVMLRSSVLSLSAIALIALLLLITFAVTTVVLWRRHLEAVRQRHRRQRHHGPIIRPLPGAAPHLVKPDTAVAGNSVQDIVNNTSPYFIAETPPSTKEKRRLLPVPPNQRQFYQTKTKSAENSFNSPNNTTLTTALLHSSGSSSGSSSGNEFERVSKLVQTSSTSISSSTADPSTSLLP